MSIIIHIERSDLVYNKASEFLINWLRLYHNITQKTLVLLSGGSCVNIYRNLEEFIGNYGEDFSPPAGGLAFAQVDERKFKIQNSQPKADQPRAEKFKMTIQNFKIKRDINANLIAETGLWEVCQKRRIPYYLVSQEGTLEQSAGQYNKIIEKLFREYVYKIAVLGIGEDGHTAGLLPGYQSVWDKNQLVTGYKVDYRQKSPMGQFCPKVFRQRITVTPKALQQLDQAMVVAVGGKKREALGKINDKKIKDMDKYPALILQKIKKVDLFTDIL